MNERVKSIINNIPAGRFFRLCYATKLPLKAENRKAGMSIVKINEITTRTGIDYNKVRDYRVKTRYDYHNENHTKWVLFRKIKYNENNNKYFLVVAPIKRGANRNTYYEVTYPDGTMTFIENLDDVYKDMIIPSYFTPSETGGRVINIDIDNILLINGEFVE